MWSLIICNIFKRSTKIPVDVNGCVERTFVKCFGESIEEFVTIRVMMVVWYVQGDWEKKEP